MHESTQTQTPKAAYRGLEDDQQLQIVLADDLFLSEENIDTDDEFLEALIEAMKETEESS